MMKGGSLPATVVGFKYIVVISGQPGVSEWDADDVVNISDRVVSDNPKRRSIVIGDKVKDAVSGFQGVITAICHYKFSTQYEVTGRSVDDKTPDSIWLDTDRLMLIKE